MLLSFFIKKKQANQKTTQGLDFVCKKPITARMRDEAMLSIFQGLDAPTSIGSMGVSSLFFNLSLADREKKRKRYLDLVRRGDDGLKELNQVANQVFGRYLRGDSFDYFVVEEGRDFSVGVVGGEASLHSLQSYASEKKIQKNWSVQKS